jgi:hypothetical protein
VLPGGTAVQVDGTSTVTCVEGVNGSVGVPNTQAQLIVRDIVSGAELRRIERTTTSCSLLWYSLDGRYEVDPFGTTADPPSTELIRITDLASGVSYQALGPPLDPTGWPPLQAQAVTAQPTPDGGLVAFIAYGPTVLRIPAEREVHFDPDYRATLYDAHGVVLAAQNLPGASTFAAYDQASGRVVASFPTPVPTGPSGRAVGDALWTFGRGPAGWQLDRFELPTLTMTYSARLPDDPAADGPGTVVADADERVVVALAENLLTAWDARTGQQLGEPVRIAGDPQILRGLWPVEDRPGQAFVATPTALELWDVPAGRLLDTFDPLPALMRDVASEGNIMARFAEGELDVWNIETREHIGTIPAPDLGSLIGFTPDGLLVAANVLRGEIVFWDLERLAQAGSMRPSENGISGVDGDILEISGTGGRMPVQLADTADRWHAQLCRVLPAEPSQAARDLLPPGTDPSAGCS